MDPYDVTHLGTASAQLSEAFAAMWRQSPADESPIRDDFTWASARGLTPIPNPVDYILGHLKIRSAAVHASLQGLASLFREPYFAVPAEVVTRSLVETALSAVWVLQGIDSPERMARGLAVALDDAKEERHLADALKDPRPGSQNLMAAAAKAAADYRSAAVRTRDALKLPHVSKPSATALFRTAFAGGPLDGIGEHAFVSTSGVAHGRPSALEKAFDPDPQGVAQRSPSSVMAWLMWRMSAEATNILAEATATHFGWAKDRWETAFETTLSTVTAEDRLARQLVAAELQDRQRQLPDHS
jgi:hypothetical protein